MKIPGFILFFLLPSMISVAQIERKPSPSKQADSALSQPGNSMNNRKDLLKDLDLTREQKIKLKEIRQANMAKKEAIENNSQLSEEEKKKQFRELQKEQAKNVQAILTDEQKEKFKAKRQEMMQENN
ncbi:MAG: hypothetical protein IPP96_13505 [Chitinophagaceae bacterium]|nr:hypothetical protein [Chitinophagaceae bacterium]